MDKNEVAELLFIADELENIESELRQTHLKIKKMKSELRKETKKHKVYRLEKRIDTYNRKYQCYMIYLMIFLKN